MCKIILGLIFSISICFGQVYNFDTTAPYILGTSNSGPVRKGLVAGYDLKTVNLLKWSAPSAITDIIVRSATVSISEAVAIGISKWVQFPAIAQLDYAYPSVNLVSGTGYTFSAYVIMDDGGAPVVGTSSDFNNPSVDFLVNIGGAVIDAGPVSHISGNVYKIQASHPAASYASVWCGLVRYAANSGRGFKVSGFQLNEGSTALPYVATTDLQTVPNMVAGRAALQLGSTSGVDTNDPTRTLSGMVFDGVDDRLTAPFAASYQAMTVMAVASTTVSPGSGSNQIAGFRSAEFTAPIIIGYGISLIAVYSSSTGGWAPTSRSISPAITGFNTIGGVVDAARLSKWDSLNGDLVFREALKSGALANSTVLTVGWGFFGGTVYFNGTISYILIYNRALTPREVRQNHQWLKAQMAQVGVSLP